MACAHPLFDLAGQIHSFETLATIHRIQPWSRESLASELPLRSDQDAQVVLPWVIELGACWLVRNLSRRLPQHGHKHTQTDSEPLVDLGGSSARGSVLRCNVSLNTDLRSAMDAETC